MISQQTLWQDIWPIVEQTIRAVVAEETEPIAHYLRPDSQAAQLYTLFGLPSMALLLKTVLAREDLGPTRSVNTNQGVVIEYAWPYLNENKYDYSAADLVTVRLVAGSEGWQIAELNPASMDAPLTSARARGILASNQARLSKQRMPLEEWLLPVAFFAGSLLVPLQAAGMSDVVEQLFVPGMQQRHYGAPLLLRGQRLWRDFVAAARPNLSKPAAWATAVEFIMSEQDMRDLTPAAVGKHYRTTVAKIAPRVHEIKQVLQIAGQDERYTDLQTTKIVLKK